jgi:hypothetical protein
LHAEGARERHRSLACELASVRVRANGRAYAPAGTSSGRCASPSLR